MKAIAAKDKDGKFFGLFVNPEEGELLTTEQLEGLLPYVLHVVKENSSSAMADKIESKLVVSGQSLSFQYLSELDTQNISISKNINPGCSQPGSHSRETETGR